jgi:hypothetical protein
MKKNCLLFLLAVVAFFSSCKKDDSLIVPDSPLSIEQIKAIINANPGQYMLPTSDIVNWYANSGLKNELINPIAVYTKVPENWIMYDSTGGFTVLRPWVITQNEEFVIEGYILARFDYNFHLIGLWEFAIHWENPDYFVKTEFHSNLEDTEEETQMNLTYKTSFDGTLNFKHSFVGNYSEIWLPMIDFSCHYFFENNYSFGGTISFNPYDGAEVDLVYIILFENVFGYIEIGQNLVNYAQNTSTLIEIFAGDEKMEERTLSYSSTDFIETTKLIPVMYTPSKIKFVVTGWGTGMPIIIQQAEYNVVFLHSLGGINYYVLQN